MASPAAAHALEGQIKAAGGQTEFHIYPDTQHAFFNDARPEIYNAAAAQSSWQRTLAFYKKHLA